MTFSVLSLQRKLPIDLNISTHQQKLDLFEVPTEHNPKMFGWQLCRWFFFYFYFFLFSRLDLKLVRHKKKSLSYTFLFPLRQPPKRTTFESEKNKKRWRIKIRHEKKKIKEKKSTEEKRGKTILFLTRKRLL